MIIRGIASNTEPNACHEDAKDTKVSQSLSS
jgi:hypothetical protein